MSGLTRMGLGAFLLTQIACVGSSPPARFYLLEPLAALDRAPAVSATAKPTLALIPVKIPQYLQRAQLVTASGKNTYLLDEWHRWAESLDDNITRVVLRDLSLLMPADVVLNNSQYARQAKLALAISILEFHIDPEGRARMTAQWQASRGDQTLISRQSSFQVSAENADAASKVQALNQCLFRLNREMAEALTPLGAN
ncbi:PqiC family protein [Methylomonas sp. SURF-2]|uniref:PqiC family protein n=1 Tax=Methylomonas subterranea TaxID=2952225 RepID=A0ABT1TJH8_9GAMM|nr:PqiC family protein [Methylomonas sp. SURF-2]MCQ8105361.1 PqiC family protein [Methylomonas sp. SURF-2]